MTDNIRGRLRWLLAMFPRRVQSGTDRFPTPRDVFDALVLELVRRGEWHHAYFDTGRWKRWAHLRIVGDEIYLHLRFAFTEEPRKVLLEKGVDVPGAWRLHKFRKRRKVVFAIRSANAERIGGFLDAYAKTLLESEADYRVTGVIESNGVY